MVHRPAQTLRSFVTRPTSTHSTTKMLPSWSKQAPCGQTNLPTGKFSRGPPRSSFHESTPASPSCSMTRLPLVDQRDAREQIRHHHHALALAEVARAPGSPRRSPRCSPASENVCSRLLLRSATSRIGVAPRVSTISPCGQSSCPGGVALAAERAQVLPGAIVLVDDSWSRSRRRRRRRRSAQSPRSSAST